MAARDAANEDRGRSQSVFCVPAVAAVDFLEDSCVFERTFAPRCLKKSRGPAASCLNTSDRSRLTFFGIGV